MKEELKLHIMRMMLLEDEEYPKVLSAIKKFQKNPTIEQKTELRNDLRKRLTDHAKNLMADEQLNKFITDIPDIGDLPDLNG